MLKKIQFSQIGLGFILISLHVAALIQFRVIASSFDSYYQLPLQLYVLWSLSLLLLVIHLAVKNVFFVSAVIVVRFLILIILTLPLSTEDYMALKVILLTTVFLPAGLNLPSPVNIILSVSMLFLILLTQGEVKIFGETVPPPSFPQLLVFALQMGMISLASCLINHKNQRMHRQGQTINRLNDALRKISSSNIGFQKYALRAGKRSQLMERRRLSREIHDSVGYVLTNILMMIKTSLVLISKDIPQAREMLIKASSQAEEGIVEIRSALHEMRSQHVPREKGLPAIHKLTRAFSEATGVTVLTEYGNIPNTFGPKTDLFIYRMIQEGLLNAFTHGEADYIRIYFWKSDHQVQISLFDNGKGSQEITKGIGLRGMEERIKKLDGTLTFRNDPLGFEIVALIPEHHGPMKFL